MRSGKLLAALVAALFTYSASAQEAGKPAPAFSLPAAGGANVSLASLKGRVVYVDFWASWCAPCKQSFPWMNEMHARYASRGLQVVAVNVDPRREAAQEFLARLPAQFLVAFDPAGALARAVDVKAMPTSLLLDAGGGVLLVHEGFVQKDRAPLEAAIAAALSGGGTAAARP